MDARGIAARISDLSALQRRGLIGVLLLAAFGVAWASLTAQSPDIPIALWWPAAGVAFVAVLASRGRRVGVALGVAVLFTAVNVIGDRPLALAVAYGIANAVELWIIVRVLTRGRPHAEFTTLIQIGWFLVSVSIGTVVFAVIAGGAATLLTGADPLVTGFSLFTSHGSALFVIAPLALISFTVPLRVPRWEPIVQPLALVVVSAIVVTVASPLALTFLIITPLMWGAFRLPPVAPALQTLILAIGATAFTEQQLGPFGMLIEGDLRGGIIALQLFMMTHAAAGLFVSGQSADWTASTLALAARERDATRVVDELRELNQQKDDFIASVSHELRTPVTSILGFSEQLVETARDDEQVQAARIIHRNARRLADLIEDVLELSRVSTSATSMRPPTRIDVRGMVRDCAEDATGLVALDRDVTVQLDLPDHPVVVTAVEQDLVRVCSNLLTNAIKFSPVGGVVRVQLRDDAEGIEVRISDNGPGVPLAEQNAIWERFYRVHSPERRAVVGTGLGLPIVRALLEERLGGSVSVQSDGQNGTTMIARLPWVAPPHERGVRAVAG